MKIPFNFNAKEWVYNAIFWIIMGGYSLTSSLVYFAGAAELDFLAFFANRAPVYILWFFITPLIRYLVLWQLHHKNKLQYKILIILVAGFLLSVFHRFAVVAVAYSVLHAAQKTTLGFTETFIKSRYYIASSIFDSFFVFLIVSFGIYFIVSYRENQEQKLRQKKLESLLNEARLQTLTMQLQPHFLFNTLNSLSALIYIDAQKADAMLTQLSTFLRLTLQWKEPFHSFAEEIRIAELYLQIQKIRFAERLQYSLSIKDEVHHLQVPVLIMQPILENSIKYALEKQNAPLFITITADKTEEYFTIQITDDGPGYPDAHTEGIGIATTRKRLDAYYNNLAQLQLHNQQSGGAITIFYLPLSHEHKKN